LVLSENNVIFLIFRAEYLYSYRKVCVFIYVLIYMVLQTVGNKKYSIQVAYVITKLVTWYIVETGIQLHHLLKSHAHELELSDKTS